MAAVITPPRASLDPSPARYHVVAADGNHVQIHQVSMRAAGSLTSTNFLVITDGGNRITISQQNAADLAPALTNFGANGVIS